MVLRVDLKVLKEAQQVSQVGLASKEEGLAALVVVLRVCLVFL